MSFFGARRRRTVGERSAPPPAPPEAATAARVTRVHGGGRASLGWLLVAVAAVLWLAQGVIGPFVVAAVIAYAFSPLVAAGHARTGLPPVLLIAIGYIVAIALIVILAALIARQASTELANLGATGPDAVAATLRGLIGSDTLDIGNQHIPVASIAQSIQDRVSGLASSPGDAVHVATRVGEFALDALLTLIVSFYLLLDGARFRDRAVQLVPQDDRPRVLAILGRIHVVLGKWLRGQILLIALVAAVVYIVLGPILHLPHALAIGLLSGVLEVLPLLGPAIATAVAGVDAFARGGTSLALGVVVFYFVLRQIEDQVVMPVVIGRAVHLHPVVTILAVLIGLSTFGVLGGLLGVPVAAAANVVFNELYPAPA